MSFNFDEELEIAGHHSAKWDHAAAATGAVGDDILPMWVADMDFRPPAAIADMLRDEAARGFLGYYGNDAPLRGAICNWLATRHGWEIEPDWISFSHGVVAGLGIALEAFTKPGDGVIIFTPVYHAFARIISAKERAVVESPLTLADGRYEMDLDALEASLTGRERMLVFCSPHNPGGRIWSPDEIRALAAFCARHDLILISDEIHMDLTFPGTKHHMTACAAPESTPRLITLSSAAKAFNIAGGETSFLVIEDAALRARMAKAQSAFGGSPNRFGMRMMEAAFTHGADWLAAVQGYIAENAALFQTELDKIPGIKVMEMHSTYLAWVDFSGTGMSRDEIEERVLRGARIAANHGPSFGTGGEFFMRFNLATPRARVLEATRRLQTAFADLQ